MFPSNELAAIWSGRAPAFHNSAKLVTASPSTKGALKRFLENSKKIWDRPSTYSPKNLLLPRILSGYLENLALKIPQKTACRPGFSGVVTFSFSFLCVVCRYTAGGHGDLMQCKVQYCCLLLGSAEFRGVGHRIIWEEGARF